MSATSEVLVCTIVSVRGASDITVRLPNGEEILAELDAAALRNRYGRVYNIKIGGSAEVVLDSPPRIVDIDQTEQEPAPAHGRSLDQNGLRSWVRRLMRRVLGR